jgi:hypothetical protein
MEKIRQQARYDQCISYHGDPVMHTNPVKVYFIG